MSKNEEILRIILQGMAEQKITRERFAKEIGCSTRAISYWKEGKRMISFEMADRALKVLGISIKIGANKK